MSLLKEGKRNDIPSLLAARLNRIEILHFFVEECAVDVNYAKPGGATATFLAAQEGSMESLLFLISQRGEFTMLNVLQKRRSLNILKYL